MSWLPMAWPFVVAAVLLFVPGVAVLAAAGVRLLLWGTAPAVSVGIIAGSAVVCGVFGWDWGPLAVLIATLLATVAAFILRGRTGSRRGVIQTLRRYAVPLAVVVVFGLIAFWRMYMSVVPGPNAIGQLQDTMFHIDVVHYIIARHDGSSLHTGYMDGSANASGFYPAGWHDVAALVVMMTGSSIPIAASAVTAALTVLVFPMTSLTLACTLFDASAWLVLGTGVAAQLVGAFPWRFLSWGQLYSNMMAVSLLPAVLAVLVVFFRTWREGDWRNRTVLGLVGLIAVAATALAQPNTVFALVVFGYLFLLNETLTAASGRWMDGRSRRRTIISIGVLTGALILVWALLYIAPFLRRTVTWVWPPFETPAQATGEFVMFGFNGNVGQPVLAAIAIVGGVVIVLRVRREAWLPISALVFGIMYVLAAGVNGRVRDVLTGFWYHDSYRLAALVAMTAVPVIGFMLAASARWLVARRGGDRWRTWRGPVASGAVVLLGLAVLFAPGASQQRIWIGQSFKTSDAWMLAPDERAFLAEAQAKVPAGVKIANNPYDGSGLAYGLFGMNVLFPAMDGNWMGTWDPEKKVVAESLTTQTFTPEVCGALKEWNIGYLLQLHDRPYSAQGEAPEWAGLRIDGQSSGFSPVLVDGDMGLYRLTGCG